MNKLYSHQPLSHSGRHSLHVVRSHIAYREDPRSAGLEKIWPIEGLKLWSPTPGVPSEVIEGVQLRSRVVALKDLALRSLAALIGMETLTH